MERFGFTIDNEKITTIGKLSLEQGLNLCYQAILCFYNTGLEQECKEQNIDPNDKEATKEIRARIHDDFIKTVSLMADSIYPEKVDSDGGTPEGFLQHLDEKIAELNKLRENNDNNKQE